MPGGGCARRLLLPGELRGRLRRQGQGQLLAHRHRLGAADDDDRRGTPPRARRPASGRRGRGAADHAAEEPARAVDAEEPGRTAHRLRRGPARAAPAGWRRSCRRAPGRTGRPPRAASRPGPEALFARSSRTLSQMPPARGAANTDTCRNDSPARSVARDHLLLGVELDPQVHPGQRRQPQRAEVDAGRGRPPARPPRPRGRVVASTSRSRCCGSGGTPRSRRLRSIRLRRRPNGMSDPPFENCWSGRPVAAGGAVAAARRARCRAARRPAGSGPARPAARPAGRSGRRGAG